MIDGPTVLKSLQEVGMTVLVIFIGTAILETILYLILVRALHYRFALPFMLIAPAVLGLVALVVIPLAWELWISMTNMSLKHFKVPEFIGLTNYVKVFTQPVLKSVTFLPLFLRTILWTFVNISFHVLGGLGLALLLNRKMRGRAIYRTLLVLPWAVPQVIAVLAWRNEFHYEFGFINLMLRDLGIAPIAWLTTPVPNFIAMCITNIWLGIPFMMIILLGGLQSINDEYYEAAQMDGANAWQQFKSITMPLIAPVMTPAIILGTVWTFNNFNIPFFINQNEIESSDILVTALFRASFQYNRYGFSAAFAFVIFILLLVYTIFYLKRSGTLKGAV
ncbi:MAG: sugar ABC transporter permease [Anaerolinea sp.]|nr:sugar ABC transporter permease [Anaerolinea sp.]